MPLQHHFSNQIMASRKRKADDEATSSKGKRPIEEPLEGPQYLDPHPDLQFPRGTVSRRKLYRLLGQKFLSTRTIDWKMLQIIGETRVDVLLPRQGPWACFFDRGADDSYRELTLEFLSTFRFSPPSLEESDVEDTDRPPPVHVRFSLGGVPKELNFRDWAVTLGIYNPAVINSLDFLLHRGVPDDWAPKVVWARISDYPWGSSVLRASKIRDPFHRYIHRVIAQTIAGRGDSQELVTHQDLYYLWSIIDGGPCNIAYCLAEYLDGRRGKKAEGVITCGGYVIAIAHRMEILTDDLLGTQTDMTKFVRLDANTFRGMGIILKISDKEQWWTTDGQTQWVYTPPTEDDTQPSNRRSPPGPPLHHRPPLPPPHDGASSSQGPRPRIILRTSTSEGSKILQLLEEMVPVIRWLVPSVQEIASELRVQLPDPPTLPSLQSEQQPIPPPSL